MQFRKNEVLNLILFFVFATVLSLGAGEIAIRIISNQVMIYNIEMLKYGVDLKLLDPMNEVSHIHKANSSSHLMGVDISLNSMGNRGRELISPKPAGEKRIYVAGSSLTMGWGVPEMQVFSYLVEEKLNQSGQSKYNFINAGVGNYSTFSSVSMLYRRFDEVLDTYANTSSAGSIIAFHLNNEDLMAGDLGLICSFGAGYSAGTVFLRKAA